ncbi:MAG: hypothetical protein ACRDZW_09390, partial [Acidimicrobiales bacterium]
PQARDLASAVDALSTFSREVLGVEGAVAVVREAPTLLRLTLPTGADLDADMDWSAGLWSVRHLAVASQRSANPANPAQPGASRRDTGSSPGLGEAGSDLVVEVLSPPGMTRRVTVVLVTDGETARYTARLGRTGQEPLSVRLPGVTLKPFRQHVLVLFYDDALRLVGASGSLR